LDALLHLLLSLLQFLQDLLGRLDVILAILLLLLLVVSCRRLVVRLVSLVGLIIRSLGVIGRVGRIIRGVVLRVLPFHNDSISPGCRRHRGCHWHCRRPVVHGLVVSRGLWAWRLRIVDSAARLGHQDYPVQSAGVGG